MCINWKGGTNLCSYPGILTEFYSFGTAGLDGLNTLLCHYTLVLEKPSSPYALFNISDVSVAVFFNFTQKLIAALLVPF
jgi:hypothetical protein